MEIITCGKVALELDRVYGRLRVLAQQRSLARGHEGTLRRLQQEEAELQAYLLALEFAQEMCRQDEALVLEAAVVC